jgi:hypothetical protein
MSNNLLARYEHLLTEIDAEWDLGCTSTERKDTLCARRDRLGCWLARLDAPASRFLLSAADVPLYRFVIPRRRHQLARDWARLGAPVFIARVEDERDREALRFALTATPA